MEVSLGKRVRLYPTKAQEKLFIEYAGAARFAWNRYLKLRSRYFKLFGKDVTLKRFSAHMTVLKKRLKYKWLDSVPVVVWKKALEDLDKAFKAFFEGKKRYPRERTRKRTRLGFACRNDTTYIKDGVVEAYIKSLKPLKAKSRVFSGKVYNPRIVYDNKYWYMSYVFKRESQMLKKRNSGVLGVDLGIKDLAILSDGSVYGNINKSTEVKRLECRKKQLERKRSLKYLTNGNKNSLNVRKLTSKINVIERRLSNIRESYRHMITKYLSSYDRVVIEDLDVSGLMRDKHKSKAISEQGWYDFRRQLEYKSRKYGFELVVADRWFASSQICSSCGNRRRGKEKLSLKDRVYVCSVCGMHMDRDVNAAKNLANYEC